MKTPWDKFFEDKMRKIFSEKKTIIDIGGGLRVIKEKNNRYNQDREWLRDLIKNVDYKILDPVDTYHPDIVGDIHSLPLENNSLDAIICIAVLEHVENPIKAFEEMFRVVKPGGYLYIYVPFLYYYHAEKGYYGDYWRFTEDSLRYLSKPFSYSEIISVRGAIGTWLRLGSLGRFKFVEKIAFLLDRYSGKINSKQVSGYNIFLIK